MCKQDDTEAIVVGRACYLRFICQGYNMFPYVLQRKKCIVNSCPARYCAKSIKSFYKAPRKRVARAQWLNRCDRNDLLEPDYTFLSDNLNYLVCSYNFSHSQYYSTKGSKTKNGIPWLVPEAAPNINLRKKMNRCNDEGNICIVIL